MDPYKVLGVDAHKIKDKESLDYLRQKAKRLWKEHAAKNQKFEMKKVNEAFEMIKRNLLRPEQEIRRSRKEREMDSLYNRQTKEIKKRVKRAREHASSASRMKRRRRLKLRAAAKARQRIRARKLVRKKPPPTGTTEGLRRVLDILLNPETPSPKFVRAVKLLKKWTTDYCTPANREYLFEVLCQICDAKIVAKEPEAGQDIIAIFAKIFCDARQWFQQSPAHQRVRKWWDIAAVWNNEIYTDDSHTFQKLMRGLQDILEDLETRPMQEMEESDGEEEEDMKNEKDNDNDEDDNDDDDEDEDDDDDDDDEDEDDENDNEQEEDENEKDKKDNANEKEGIKIELPPREPAAASNTPSLPISPCSRADEAQSPPSPCSGPAVCPRSPPSPCSAPSSPKASASAAAAAAPPPSPIKEEEQESESESEIKEEDDPFGDLRAMREQRREQRRREKEERKGKRKIAEEEGAEREGAEREDNGCVGGGSTSKRVKKEEDVVASVSEARRKVKSEEREKEEKGGNGEASRKCSSSMTKVKREEHERAVLATNLMKIEAGLVGKGAKEEKKEGVKQEKVVPTTVAPSTEVEVEQPDPNFLCMIPSETQIFDKLREHFVLCLENLFRKRVKTLWSRDQIDRFFQDVYYKRERFTESQQEAISRMQGAIKNKQKGVTAIGANSCPLLSHVPVVDGRDLTTFGGGDQAWALKQF